MIFKDHAWGVIESFPPVPESLKHDSYMRQAALETHQEWAFYYYCPCSQCKDYEIERDYGITASKVKSARTALATLHTLLTEEQYASLVHLTWFEFKASDGRTVRLRWGISGNIFVASNSMFKETTWTSYCCHPESFSNQYQCVLDQYLALKSDARPFMEKAMVQGRRRGMWE